MPELRATYLITATDDSVVDTATWSPTAGPDWNAAPVWGRARNTWIKVLVD